MFDIFPAHHRHPHVCLSHSNLYQQTCCAYRLDDNGLYQMGMGYHVRPVTETNKLLQLAN